MARAPAFTVLRKKKQLTKHSKMAKKAPEGAKRSRAYQLAREAEVRRNDRRERGEYTDEEQDAAMMDGE